MTSPEFTRFVSGTVPSTPARPRWTGSFDVAPLSSAASSTTVMVSPFAYASTIASSPIQAWVSLSTKIVVSEAPTPARDVPPNSESTPLPAKVWICVSSLARTWTLPPALTAAPSPMYALVCDVIAMIGSDPAACTASPPALAARAAKPRSSVSTPTAAPAVTSTSSMALTMAPSPMNASVSVS